MTDIDFLKLFDLSDWAQLTLTGPDRQSFLQSFCTNDISKLPPEHLCEAFVPDIKGRILGHAFIIKLAGELRLIAVPGTNSTLYSHLSKYLLDSNVEIHDRTGTDALFCLVGQNAFQVLGLPEDLSLNQFQQINIEGSQLHAARVDVTNSPTYFIFGEGESSRNLIESLQSQHVAIGDPNEFDALRIAAGFPYFGRDISENLIAQEAARTDQSISFTKGCYLGQGPIARLDAMGHTNKELRGLLIDAADVTPGCEVLFEEKPVGTISSSANFNDGKSIALAVLRAKYIAPGTQLNVKTESGMPTAVVYWPRLQADLAD